MSDQHDPPWKARHFNADSPHGGIWYVSTDRADPSEEYDVFEDLTEGHARLASAAPEMLAELRRLERSAGEHKLACASCDGVLRHRSGCTLAAAIRKAMGGAA
jgi:hypothetical protein